MPSFLTKIDRLSISVQEDLNTIMSFLDSSYSHLGEAQSTAGRGMLGFKHSLTVSYSDTPVARVAFGGTSQKGKAYLDISGVGCGLVKDWGSMQSLVEGLPSPNIRRVDIAADYFANEVTHEMVYDAYQAGEFKKAGTGGKPPKMNQILPGSTDEGRTIYIGTRDSDSYFRGYEKGKKEFQDDLTAWEKKGFTIDLDEQTHKKEDVIYPLRDWYRCELEMKGKTRDIPLDVFDNRDEYFAGAYPFLSRILPHVNPKIIVPQKKIAMADLEQALQHIRTQYGSTLFTALHVYGGDIIGLMERIIGDHHNERLLASGAMIPDEVTH